MLRSIEEAAVKKLVLVSLVVAAAAMLAVIGVPRLAGQGVEVETAAASLAQRQARWTSSLRANEAGVVVLRPDGLPAADAAVALCEVGSPLVALQASRTSSDGLARFDLAALGAGSYTACVLSESGAAAATVLVLQPRAVGVVQLQAGCDLKVELAADVDAKFHGWTVVVRPLDDDDACGTSFKQALDAADALDDVAGRRATMRTSDGASIRRAEIDGTAVWRGLPRCTVLVEAWRSDGGDGLQPAPGTSVQRTKFKLDEQAQVCRLVVATRRPIGVDVTVGGAPAPAGVQVALVCWNEADGSRGGDWNGLHSGTTDENGRVMYAEAQPAPASMMVAYARLGDRWARSAAMRAGSTANIGVNLPDAGAAPLRVRCVDEAGGELQASHVEVLDAQQLARHGVAHARLWSSESGSGNCPVVFPSGTLQVSASIDPQRHPGLRSCAIAQVQPGAEEVQVVFARANPVNPMPGSVRLACQGAADGTILSVLSHGSSFHERRTAVVGGSVLLDGYAPGRHGICVKSSDGKVGFAVAQTGVDQPSPAAVRLQPGSTLEFGLGQGDRLVQWSVAACDADGTPLLVLADGADLPAGRPLTMRDLPAVDVLVVCTRKPAAASALVERTLSRATLRAGETTRVQEGAGGAGNSLEIVWGESLDVKFLTFEVHAPGSDATSVPSVLFWNTPVDARANSVVLDSLPAGLYTLVAYPYAGASEPTARKQVRVAGGANRLQLGD